MKIKLSEFRTLWLAAVTFLLGVLIVSGIHFLDTRNSVFVVSTPNFRLRVSRVMTFDFNYRYVFEASPTKLDDWRQIHSVLLDDPIPLSVKQIQVIDDTTGYLTLGNVFAVTRDSAATWSFFDVRRDSDFGMRHPDSGWISDAAIDIDGTGTMNLRHGPFLVTRDFGRSWTEGIAK